jgi:hypothetical protein
MPRLLTQAQFARKTKYSRARITQLVKQGVIVLKKGKVDPAQANSAIEANIDRSRQLKAEAKSKPAQTPQMEFAGNGFNTNPKTGTATNGFNTELKPSLTDARRDHELLKTKISETKLRELRGKLVPKNEATKMVIALGAAIKLTFLSLPRRLAEILAPMTDPKEIELLLRSEIRNVIQILEQARHVKSKRPRAKNPPGRVGDHLESSGRDLHPGLG